MRPHVTALRKTFQTRTRMGKLKAASNCAKCGITAEEDGRKLEMHHIISIGSLEPDSTYDPNVQENIITLCHRCHQAFHKCYEDDYGDQLPQWIEEVPLDEMRANFAEFERRKAERKRMEIEKSRSRNKK